MKKLSGAKNRALFLSRAAVIAALYVVLTLLSGLLGLDGKGIIQVRISEALCILPIFSFAAVPGVTIGCLIYNLFFCSPIDAIFGTLATLIGVLIVYFVPIFKRNVFLASVPTVISNTLIIPYLVAFVYNGGGLSAVPFLMLTVAIGEIIACTVFGAILFYAIRPYRSIFFGNK